MSAVHLLIADWFIKSGEDQCCPVCYGKCPTFCCCPCCRCSIGCKSANWCSRNYAWSTPARRVCTYNAAHRGVGMEGGIEFDQDGSAWLFSMVVMVTTNSGESLARGGQLRLPPLLTQRLRAGAELGSLMDELTDTTNLKHGLGAVGYLTNSLITREDAYRDSFSRALAPLLHPQLYASVPAQGE